MHDEIQIATDCSRQPRVTVGVVVLPRSNESEASDEQPKP